MDRILNLLNRMLEVIRDICSCRNNFIKSNQKEELQFSKEIGVNAFEKKNEHHF